MRRKKPPIKACRAASQLGRTVSRALDGSELTPAGYRLLAYLSTGGTAATVLADKLAVSRPTVTATVDWLEPRGFVVRTSDPVDGRRVNIAMTEKGKAALAAADLRVAARLDEVLESLNEEEAAAVVAALDRLHDALNDDRVRRHGPLVRSRSNK